MVKRRERVKEARPLLCNPVLAVKAVRGNRVMGKSTWKLTERGSSNYFLSMPSSWKDEPMRMMTVPSSTD